MSLICKRQGGPARCIFILNFRGGGGGGRATTTRHVKRTRWSAVTAVILISPPAAARRRAARRPVRCIEHGAWHLATRHARGHTAGNQVSTHQISTISPIMHQYSSQHAQQYTSRSLHGTRHRANCFYTNTLTLKDTRLSQALGRRMIEARYHRWAHHAKRNK